LSRAVKLARFAGKPSPRSIAKARKVQGVEQAYRFLDPATADPRAVLNAARATHVAVCAWRAEPLPELAARYPFAATLIEGRLPSWLVECAGSEASPLRIYRYRNVGQPELACPAWL
jgi:hypothetical protein